MPEANVPDALRDLLVDLDPSEIVWGCGSCPPKVKVEDADSSQ